VVGGTSAVDGVDIDDPARESPGMEETGAVGVAGGELFYRVAGKGDPLLLIHGVGPDSRAWTPTFEKLAEDHRVIAYDRRGYGRSSAPPGGGWRSHGEDAAILVEELGLSRPCVVGWSGGGYVAIHLAVETPELVRNLVLAETGLPLPPSATPSYLLMFLRAQVIGRLRGHRAAAEDFLRWVLTENGTTTLDRKDYPEERKELSLGNADGMWADINPRGRPDLSRGRLGQVSCPVTLLVGDMGQRWFRKSADALVEMLPDGRLETIAGTNHAFTFHQPERFAEAIKQAAAR
jgi:pimeloyl-ACP methyl ester carboxylesterase